MLQRGNIDDVRPHYRGRDRERRERNIDGENAHDHVDDRKAAVRGALIEMRAMRLPDCLAVLCATHECDSRVGEII